MSIVLGLQAARSRNPRSARSRSAVALDALAIYYCFFYLLSNHYGYELWPF